MLRILRRAPLALASSILIASVLGCSITTLTIRFPGFGTGQIDGFWLWKNTGSSYQRVCRYHLSNTFRREGSELVKYVQTCLDDRRDGIEWEALVVRTPGAASTVTLELIYQEFGAPAWYRASAYNASGESGLSSTRLRL
jgi:hypothetical protein